jgi:hypothetical protein
MQGRGGDTHSVKEVGAFTNVVDLLGGNIAMNFQRSEAVGTCPVYGPTIAAGHMI